MSTMRYSGKIRIRITYLEPWAAGTPAPAGRSTRLNGEYRCFLRADGYAATATIIVGAPAHLTNTVDSPEAFDGAAEAAIGFAEDEYGGWADLAAYNEDGYHIARSANAFRGLAAKSA
jgi:hypothetical protein